MKNTDSFTQLKCQRVGNFSHEIICNWWHPSPPTRSTSHKNTHTHSHTHTHTHTPHPTPHTQTKFRPKIFLKAKKHWYFSKFCMKRSKFWPKEQYLPNLEAHHQKNTLPHTTPKNYPVGKLYHIRGVNEHSGCEGF